MKRAAPEDFEPEDDMPLFANPSASKRGHARANLAASKASRLESGWKSSAVEAVKAHAQRNPEFLAEHVARSIPDGADPRAMGAVMKQAERLGYVRAAGFAIDSLGSPKTKWASLLYARSHA